jgi:hypothetical protein
MTTIFRREIHVDSVLAGAALGLAGGVLAGYYLCHRRNKKTFEQRVTQEVAGVKAYYQERTKAAVFGGGDEDEWGPASLGEGRTIEEIEHPELVLGIADFLGPVTAHASSDVPAPGDASVDDSLEGLPGDDDDPDQPDEEDNSVPDSGGPVRTEPYVITIEEFHEDRENYRKLTITWYEGDSTLTDDQDVPIRDTRTVLGVGFNAHFGKGSNDPNIVYIRNDRLEADFEVVKDERGFAEVVLNYGRPK